MADRTSGECATPDRTSVKRATPDRASGECATAGRISVKRATPDRTSDECVTPDHTKGEHAADRTSVECTRADQKNNSTTASHWASIGGPFLRSISPTDQ